MYNSGGLAGSNWVCVKTTITWSNLNYTRSTTKSTIRSCIRAISTR
jgi:hypothetical protein